MKTRFVALLALLCAPAAGAATPISPGMRLIETSPQFAAAMVAKFPGRIRLVTKNVITVPLELVKELSRTSHELTGHCGGFMDVTGEEPRKTVFRASPELPPLGARKEWITSLLDDVRPTNIKDFDNAYTGHFTTRYASSDEGTNAPQWLREQWQKMAEKAGRADIKVELLPGPDGYNQQSVRITIPGKDATLPVLVLGAHLDSINMQGDGSAPGADDDASGIAALTEAYRVMLAHNVNPHRTIQIFGYAAEEVGLLGSRVVAEHYQSKGYAVRAVLQLDMVAWAGDSKTITFITDNVDRSLTLWTEQLYGLYLGGDIKEDRCGYGCSDHASWHRYGYAAVMPFESPMDEMNGRIHTARDLWDELLDPEYAARFTRLALAWTAELSN